MKIALKLKRLKSLQLWESKKWNCGEAHLIMNLTETLSLNDKIMETKDFTACRVGYEIQTFSSRKEFLTLKRYAFPNPWQMP